MTWFDSGKSSVPAGDRLEALWRRPEILQPPGAHNALSALLAIRAGFEALYLSGGAVSASLGLPDLGVMTIEEVLVFVRSITRASDLPLIVDGDTGYGEALNVMRLVRDLEDAGAAAVQLEDQILPKKCGHLSDKRLADPEAMAAKIAAAVKAAKTRGESEEHTAKAMVEAVDGMIHSQQREGFFISSRSRRSKFRPFL